MEYQDIKDLDFPRIPSSLQEKRAAIIDLCKEALKGDFVRGDYKELVKLTLLYLEDGEVSAAVDRLVRPGALHKARFMSKILYCIKIVLLNKKIAVAGATVLGRGQLPKVKRFVQFVVFCYVPWWITAPVASAAPMNDLKLINSFHWYNNIDSVVAKAALVAVGRHTWYLTEELVVLSLFNHYVSNDMKQSIAEKLKVFGTSESCVNRVGTGFGKPQLPPVPESIEDDVSKFVGKDSSMFFKILKIDRSFLDLPVKDWDSDESYKHGKQVVAKLSCVNDAAERGVKLCNDFLPRAKKEENFQNVLQVVENCRNSLPDQRKRMKKSQNWYLVHE